MAELLSFRQPVGVVAVNARIPDAPLDRSDVVPRVQYWRSRYGEVDFVFEVDETPVPITMAYQTGLDEATNAIEEFHTEHDTQVGFVLTGDVVSATSEIAVLDDGVVTVPYWLYLLLC